MKLFRVALARRFGGGRERHGPSARPTKVGVVVPFSGANADLGHQMDRAFDLYVKLHAKDIAPYKVELIKRDEGPPTGAVAKRAATELIINAKVQSHRLRHSRRRRSRWRRL